MAIETHLSIIRYLTEKLHHCVIIIVIDLLNKKLAINYMPFYMIK